MMTMLQTHPERLVIAIAALSWGWMLREAAAAQRLSCCAANPTAAADFALWMVMVGAMMLPTTAPAVRDVATRSYRSRRPRAVLEYILGYLAAWILFDTDESHSTLILTWSKMTALMTCS